MAKNSEQRQASMRAISSGTEGNVNQSWMEVFDGEAVAAGTINEREILRHQTNLTSTETNINGLRAEFAAHKSVARWDDVTDLT